MALSDVRKSDSSGEHAVYNSSVHSLIVELMSVRGIAEHGRVFGKLILNFNYKKSIRKSKSVHGFYASQISMPVKTLYGQARWESSTTLQDSGVRRENVAFSARCQLEFSSPTDQSYFLLFFCGAPQRYTIST